MQYGRPVAVLGGVRIPFCRQNTAYADVGNLGLSVRTLGALVEKFGLQNQALGEVAMGAVIKHSSDAGHYPAARLRYLAGYADSHRRQNCHRAD